MPWAPTTPSPSVPWTARLISWSPAKNPVSSPPPAADLAVHDRHDGHFTLEGGPCASHFHPLVDDRSWGRCGGCQVLIRQHRGGHPKDQSQEAAPIDRGVQV